MTTNDNLEDTWVRYVGDQSPKDFLAGEADPYLACLRYAQAVAKGELFGLLENPIDPAVLAEDLMAYCKMRGAA